MRFWLSTSLALAISSSVWANTHYISDDLTVPLRSGDSLEYRIVKLLPAGEPVTLIQSKKNGWSKVATDKFTGWMPTRFLINTPSAKQRLEELTGIHQKLKQTHEKQKQSLEHTQTQLTKAQTELRTLTQSHANLQQKYARLSKVAADPQAVEERNLKLEQEIVDLNSANLMLEQQNQMLADTRERNWFLAGAGVLIMGLLVGLGAAFLIRKPKSMWK